MRRRHGRSAGAVPAALLVAWMLTASAGRPDVMTPASARAPVSARSATAPFGSVITAAQVVKQDVAVIDKAKSVDLEIYELGDPAAIGALIAAHERRVTVRVVLDRTEGESRAAAGRLRAGGVAVRTLLVPGGIDHVKLLVTNDTVVIGGVNLGSGSSYTSDIDVVLPPLDVHQAERVFDADWTAARNGTQPAAGTFGPFVTGSAVEPAIAHVLRSATGSCTVLANYLSDYAVQNALISARRRGVIIDVLLNRDAYGARAAAAVLQAAGVSVAFAPRYPYLHAKVIACGKSAIVGSANFSYDGMNVNHELDVVLSGALAARVTSAADRMAGVR